MSRKTLPYILLALIGGAGVFAWKSQYHPVPTEVKETPAARVRSPGR